MPLTVNSLALSPLDQYQAKDQHGIRTIQHLAKDQHRTRTNQHQSQDKNDLATNYGSTHDKNEVAKDQSSTRRKQDSVKGCIGERMRHWLVSYLSQSFSLSYFPTETNSFHNSPLQSLLFSLKTCSLQLRNVCQLCFLMCFVCYCIISKYNTVDQLHTE